MQVSPLSVHFTSSSFNLCVIFSGLHQTTPCSARYLHVSFVRFRKEVSLNTLIVGSGSPLSILIYNISSVVVDFNGLS